MLPMNLQFYMQKTTKVKELDEWVDKNEGNILFCRLTGING